MKLPYLGYAETNRHEYGVFHVTNNCLHNMYTHETNPVFTAIGILQGNNLTFNKQKSPEKFSFRGILISNPN